SWCTRRELTPPCIPSGNRGVTHRVSLGSPHGCTRQEFKSRRLGAILAGVDQGAAAVVTRDDLWTCFALRLKGVVVRFVVQYGPNTRQNRRAGPTRDQHETTRVTTPLNLQNLHPRFKSGRRLQSQSVYSGDIGNSSFRRHG